MTAQIMGNAYKKPDYNSTIVGRVLKGKTYKPFEKKGEFYKIQLSDGVYGWAPMDSFKSKKKKTVFTLDVAKLRSGPGPGYGVLQKLEPATDLIVLGSYGQYYQVEIKETKLRGYILKAMVFE
ncbi:MAG: SH3 domain-containing protein [Calditrichaeota bacterium]|nr:SH3 domain-containing protein [Calditrichota bacterium]